MTILTYYAPAQSTIRLPRISERVHTPVSGWHFDLVRQVFAAENVKFGYNPKHKDYKLCICKSPNRKER
jgi:hypothetical protein